MDLSDVLLGVCLLALLVAAFVVAPVAGLIVLALEAGLLSLAFPGVKLPKVRIPWRS